MAKNPVNWFEIPVKSLARAVKFYSGVFGFKMKAEEMGDMKMAFFPGDNMKTYGSTGALMKSKGGKPSKTGTLVYLSVKDISATLRKVRARGGKTILPKTPIGKYGFVANFADSEGNRIALHSMK